MYECHVTVELPVDRFGELLGIAEDNGLKALMFAMPVKKYPERKISGFRKEMMLADDSQSPHSIVQTIMRRLPGIPFPRIKEETHLGYFRGAIYYEAHIKISREDYEKILDDGERLAEFFYNVYPSINCVTGSIYLTLEDTYKDKFMSKYDLLSAYLSGRGIRQSTNMEKVVYDDNPGYSMVYWANVIDHSEWEKHERFLGSGEGV